MPFGRAARRRRAQEGSFGLLERFLVCEACLHMCENAESTDSEVVAHPVGDGLVRAALAPQEDLRRLVGASHDGDGGKQDPLSPKQYKRVYMIHHEDTAKLVGGVLCCQTNLQTQACVRGRPWGRPHAWRFICWRVRSMGHRVNVSSAENKMQRAARARCVASLPPCRGGAFYLDCVRLVFASSPPTRRRLKTGPLRRRFRCAEADHEGQRLDGDRAAEAGHPHHPPSCA